MATSRRLALGYAEAVNEELRRPEAGADVVQIDEPYLQARPEPAPTYAVDAIGRALEGIEGETVLHTCFGYAHVVHDRPSGYPFLRELNAVRRPPLHRGGAAEPRPRRAARAAREDGRARRARPRLRGGRDARRGRRPHPPRARRRSRRAPRGRARLRHEVPPRERAFRKLEAMVAGARLVD